MLAVIRRRANRTRFLVEWGRDRDAPAHPLQTSIDIASLAPKAEITVYPWKEPPELKERTIDRVRTFLKAHQPKTAMQ